MKAESLYIQKLTYDENTGNEIIGLFPSEANPAIVSSYTYDAKRMGGAPTLTATIYSSEPLQWKKEEFVEYNGDRFFASYTPNSTKDNSSRMWKNEITFTSRRELLDNTLFFDVVVDDVDTQNKDRYRSNQTKFTFGGTIHEFVARVNSSMAYCGLYRPTDEYKGYYVVVDEGYGADEVKEVSFEDQYLTDVLQLINTTFELDYYWDGNVCHVGKVQHDLTDTPIKYGSSDALISVSKENANYKIVDMITGYGSSDNLPYYYPNDDEFGEAIFDAKNIASEHVDVTLSDYLRYSKYNDNLVLFKSKKGKYEGNVDVSTLYVRDTYSPENLTQADNSQNPKVKCWFWVSIKINVKKGQIIDFSKISFNFELFDYIQKKENITNLSSATRTINIYTTYHDLYKNVCTDSNLGDACSVEFAEDGTFYIDIDAIFSYNCKVFTMDGKRTFHDSSAWKVSFSGDVVFSLDTNSEYSWKNGDNYIPLDNSGIYVNGIASAKYVEYDYNFRKNDEGIYGFDKIYTGTEDDAVQVSVTGRKWIAPSSVLMPSIYRNTKGAERFYYALNNTHKLPSGSGYYEFVNLYKKGNPHQGTVTFGDIKPTIKGIVNAEGQLFGEIADIAFDSADSDVKDSDGKYIHSYFYIKLHKFNGDFGFDLFAHALASEPAKINLIKSNGCPACSFVIYNQPSADNSKCYNCVSVDENGNLKPVRTDKNDYIFANASDAYEDKLNQDSTQKELWIAVQKDTSTLGIIMPNASAGFKPQKGDLFVITGIKPPKVLVTAAEKRLDDALIKHMSENNTDQFNYSVKFSRIFLQENPDFASKLNENAKLSIQIQGDSDSDGNLISHEVFVSNYSVKVDNDELAEVEIELVNSLEVTKSDTKQIIDAVKGETVKSLSSMVGGSNTNSFNASITDKMYLSKLKDDTANGTITWEKVQKFLQGLLVGGGSWTPDTEGRSHLITDYLEVRMKAIFEELVINKTSTIGGKEIISPAGGVVAHKVEEVTVTYNNVSQKAYRCYFLAEQEGDAVDNDFAVGDQVRSESFNVLTGTYHKAGNHFYWRLVIGRDEDPVELEGKKYHYIDLSDTDCATASDVPAKGDVLNQCGNRTDVERQNCLIFSAVDTYSPSISLYHGINSYSFANREYVEYGVNKQNNKAFFNVYGDMYVGDRPTKENGYEGSSYIRYDSSTKQVSVKGKISAKSTVDGKELSQYIKENSAKGLTEEQVNNLIKNSQVIADLQNQVDGAIETWFYDGVPTLENAPAISWKTDKDKEIHLGDLYYDNKTGKAYRFAKDSNTYKWTIITDTDIAKALSDARMAQETANGKMKVFSVQPTTPYQVGDIWVNATYPSDGSTYKNEVLRCQTNKAAGSQFAIGDWIKASKYTDDTVANAAKKAAENAQKAAETAQTNITDLGKTVTDNKKEFDNYVTDGYLEPSEIAAMAQDSKRLEDDFAAAQKSYNEVKNAEVLKDTKELTDLNTAFATLTSAKTELVTYLSDISKNYNKADTNGKATIVSAVGTKFTNFQSAYSAFYDKLGLANAYITRKIYGDLGVVIGDVSTYQYLKKVLADGVETEINGGLILTSLIALRDHETKRVESGINGVIDKTAKGNGIATWWGGYMNDGEVVGFDKKEDYSKQAATSLVRFDGSGYMANGAIWWGTDGKIHADPTSFIISEKNLGAYLTFFEPTWKEGSAGASVADLVSLKPNAPFSKLGVSGDATFEGAISFHGIKLTYDSTNKAIKIDGNLYATGGITAYGAGASTTGGGGGLNGSVMSYSNALKLTSESLSEIASAYSIKALDSRISSLEGGSATAISVSGSGNAVTSVTKNGTTISVVKGSTFLTSHQSLDGYVNAISVSGSGNAITSVSKSGKGITFTKGSTFLTSHQSLANYYTKGQVDNIANGKSSTSHTHSVTINGVTKTIAATGGTAVDLGTYLTSHQSLNGYATQSWVKSQGYLTSHQDVSVLTMANDRYYSSGQWGINMRNSDIIGVNCIYTNDVSETPDEAILFCRSNGNYDGIRAVNGELYFSDNVVRTTGKYNAEYKVYHTGNLTKLSQLTNDKNFVTGSVSGQTITINGVSTTWQNTWRGITDSYSGTSTGTSLSQKGANSLYNALHNGYASSAGNADTVDGYHATSGRTFDGNINWSSNWNDAWSDGTNKHPWYGFDHRHPNTGAYSTTITDFFGMTIKTANTLRLDFGTLLLNGTDIHNINVASASKLATARSIWGQSFDGTGNVNGTIYINNSNSSNGAIRLNSDISSNARISAIDDQVIFNTGNAIRFGETAWDWNKWAGLKYTHSNKTIYLGIADNSVFNANSAQSNGTLRLAGITTITPDSGARIGGSGGNLYLGNANNSGWVCTQDICSQTNSSLWSIRQDGNAYFKNIYSGAATINGNLSVDGLISNKGILPANYEFNNKGTSCYVSADALCSGITAITDSIQVNQVTVQYSNDSGNSWTNYPMGNDAKFNLYASNAGLTKVWLGYNVITGNNDAEKLAQVKKNELIVSFYISNSCYAQPYFASVDISNGIDTICTVEILNNSGAVVETYTKHMTGWNQINYISLLHDGNAGYGVGNNDRRYIRFKFKHDQKTTALRNTVINKIRIFSFTKYSFPTDRFMGHTGHIYNFDYNMNTYFPNSILAKGGVTAYQSSDIRLKQDLRKLDYLGIIKAMGGTYGFAWKKDNTRSIGWIAQHVLCNPHLKDIVETDEKGYYKINYWSPKLIATAFGAIEQVGDEVSRLKARVVFLESEVQRLSGDKEDCNKKRLDNKNINSLN